MSEEKIGQHYLAALHQAFPGVVLDEAWQTKDQLTVTVKVNYLPEVVEFLYYKQGGWLSVLFGNDERKLNGHYAVYYVLSMEQGTKCWITVRVEVDANKPEYPSVTPRVPAAVWGEREVRDMYGLNRATSACSLTAKILSTPTTACSTSIAGWKSWRKPGWATTKSPSCRTACAVSAASPTAPPTPPRWRTRWALWCRSARK